jgi:hypothetical protein
VLITYACTHATGMLVTSITVYSCRTHVRTYAEWSTLRSMPFFVSCIPTPQLVPSVSQYNILPRAEHLFVHSLIGCVVLYDGRVAWSDLAARTTQVLAQYVLLQDTHSVRTQALQLVQTLGTAMCGGVLHVQNSVPAAGDRVVVSKSPTHQTAALQLATVCGGKRCPICCAITRMCNPFLWCIPCADTRPLPASSTGVGNSSSGGAVSGTGSSRDSVKKATSPEAELEVGAASSYVLVVQATLLHGVCGPVAYGER